MNQFQNKAVDLAQTESANGAEVEQAAMISLDKQLPELVGQAMIGRITPEVVHDLNNQMTGIMGYAELLLMKNIEDPGIKNGLKNILFSAEKSKSLLDNLLILSHQETSVISLTNVNLLLEKVLEMRSCALRHRQIEFILELARDIPTISIDGAKFQKTILNMIFKAEESLENQPLGKRLVLETLFLPQDHEIIIKISDNVSETSLDRHVSLAELDQEDLSADLGIRLGLMEACRWIESLGGSLKVESIQGKGTTYSIHLLVKE